ncbi:hypothetical protein [Streptomyces sp. NBC_00443]|uniref:hypothetical protein n=1 Tax=Streptomyces sp. NBC_00443 TaxID=2975743 RepID=UPI002E1AF03C
MPERYDTLNTHPPIVTPDRPARKRSARPPAITGRARGPASKEGVEHPPQQVLQAGRSGSRRSVWVVAVGFTRRSAGFGRCSAGPGDSSG